MFSLNLDSLFLGLLRARALARALAPQRRERRAPADPREHQRIRDELRLAQEKPRLDVTRGRLLW